MTSILGIAKKQYIGLRMSGSATFVKKLFCLILKDVYIRSYMNVRYEWVGLIRWIINKSLRGTDMRFCKATLYLSPYPKYPLFKWQLQLEPLIAVDNAYYLFVSSLGHSWNICSGNKVRTSETCHWFVNEIKVKIDESDRSPNKWKHAKFTTLYL